LSLHTKLRVYMTCIVPVLLYGSELWTFLSSDSSRLEAFHMRCQRQILRVKWQDMIRNTAIAEKTGLPIATAVIDALRTVLFSQVARFDDRVPTRSTLRLAIDVCLGTPPLHPGSDLAAALVTRDSNSSFTPTFPSRSAGMLLLVVVMVLRCNFPRRTRDPDDDDELTV